MTQLGTLTMRPVKLPSFGVEQVSITCYDESNLARLMAEDAKRAGIQPKLPQIAKKPVTVRIVGDKLRRAEIAAERLARVLGAVNDVPRSTHEIADAIGDSRDATYQRLCRLEQDGAIRRTGEAVARWALIGGEGA